MSRMEDKVSKQSKHYDGIDGLRAFSSIGIVLMHVLANGNYSVGGFVFERLIPSFTNLIFLFMIISGFAMCCGYYDEIVENKIPVEKFYSKRYKKIWPFFAVLCILDILISPSVDSLYEVFANLTLCFGLLPNSNISVIGVGWFLGVVFVFYLVFPFVCYLLSNQRRAWFAFSVAVIFNVLCSDYFELQRTDFIYCAMFFLAGGLIYLYRKKIEILVIKYRRIVLILCVVITMMQFVLRNSVVLIVIMFSTYVIYTLGVSKKGILKNSITHFLSSISMEMYLCHMVVYRVIEKTDSIHLFGNGLVSYVTTSIITILGAIMTSIVVRWGIEKIKLLHLSKSKKFIISFFAMLRKRILRY